MNAWLKGALLGLAVGLVVAAWMARATTFTGFLRIGEGGRALLDLRLDESAFGRVRNIPVGVLGEASFAKRSWLLVTTYAFTLELRPDVAAEFSRAVRALEVSAGLPGRVVATNATRAGGGTAVWERPPAGPLTLKTRLVHWGRIAVIAVLALGAFLFARRP